MSVHDETIEDEDEVSFAPTPSPEEARAKLAALRGKPLDAPSKLGVVTEEDRAEQAAAPAPAAQPDLAAQVAALVAESLKKLGDDRPLFGPYSSHGLAEDRQKAPKAEKPLFKPVKVRITTRVDADVLEAFKALGPGWQTRMNDVLRENMPSAPTADD